MWETLNNVLVSKNGLYIIILAAVIVVLLVIMGKKGLLKIHTKYVSIGDDERERRIIREQCEWTHTYISGLIVGIEQAGGGTDKMLHGGYFTKYILELVYDEFVSWITLNHIENTEAYISVKQDKIAALVYAQGPRDEYKTPEFRKTMDKWVTDIIKQCVLIREMYSKK